jgi:hypothetical protein
MAKLSRFIFETSYLAIIVSLRSVLGLPGGIFSNQKSQFGQILEGLAMEDVGIFYCHLVYFTVIWYILWLFGFL